jgi:hypothetical protein
MLMHKADQQAVKKAEGKVSRELSCGNEFELKAVPNEGKVEDAWL